MVDLLYVAHNRLAFTETTFAALVANTNWDLVAQLHVLDDASTDGTREYLEEQVTEYRPWAAPFSLTSDRFGGPVAAMNYALDNAETGVLAKVDSDCVVCPGWLDVMLDVLDHAPDVDALGMEPGFASIFPGFDVKRSYLPARWIGGLGLIRTRVFARRRPVMKERFFGWTQFQQDFVRSAWVDPDLPVFLLDHLDFEPWRSLTASYIAQGWQRAVVGAPYTQDQRAYYDWWLREQVVA